MSYINIDKVIEALIEPVLFGLTDTDNYVAKTAAIAVAKLYSYDKNSVEKSGVLEKVKELINHGNCTVCLFFVLEIIIFEWLLLL